MHNNGVREGHSELFMVVLGIANVIWIDLKIILNRKQGQKVLIGFISFVLFLFVTSFFASIGQILFGIVFFDNELHRPKVCCME